jgi:hypothetical protein
MGFGLVSGLKQNLIVNRRRSPRRERDLNAWIRPEGSIAVQQCRILDLSQTGVRLAVVDANQITKTFILFLSKYGAGAPRNCEMAARNSDWG